MDPSKAFHSLAFSASNGRAQLFIDGTDISGACIGLTLKCRSDGHPIASIDLVCSDVSVHADHVTLELPNISSGKQ
jgi:hypothetical protein